MISITDHETLSKWLRSTPPASSEHSSLLLRCMDLRAEGSSDFWLAVRKKVIAEAEAFLPCVDTETNMDKATAADASGKRKQAPRNLQKWLQLLAFSWHLTNEEKFVEAAAKCLEFSLTIPDWGNSGRDGLPTNFLDAAELGTAVCIALDLLCSQLEPRLVGACVEKVAENAFKPALACAKLLKPMWWIRAENNWNNVCIGGLLFMALVLRNLPDGSVTPGLQALQQDILHNVALPNIRHGLAAAQPDGVYPEGMTYWDFAASFTSLATFALEQACGAPIQLPDDWNKTAEFMSIAQASSGKLFNFADSPVGDNQWFSEAMWFMAHRLGRPELLWRQTQSLSVFLRAKTSDASVRQRRHRFFPLLLLWLPPTALPACSESILPLNWVANLGKKVQVAIYRTSGTFLALKGGTPSAGHGHMDIGSIVVEARGQRWVEDLGLYNYGNLEIIKGEKLKEMDISGQVDTSLTIHNLTKGSPRWLFFRHHNRGHSTLTIDGQPQVVSGFGAIARCASDSFPFTSIINLQPLYAAMLSSAFRTVELHENATVVVRDEFQAKQGPTGGVGRTIRSSFPTKTAVTVPAGDEKSAILVGSQKGVYAEFRIDEPAEATWRVQKDLPPEGKESHAGVSLLFLETVLRGASQAMQVSISFHGGESSTN